jgi:Na+:H+ antiporter, NhaA family
VGEFISGPGRRFVDERFIRPAQAFASLQASGGICLLLAAIAAMVWANSPWSDEYFELWGTHLSLDLHLFGIEESLGHAVNDALMVIFFFVVGLEIKREVLHGELANPRKAALPVAAALGGMIVPAGIYALWNFGGDGSSGWGIPMATDIAFALGVLALLGTRAPFALKVFLLALAIADDLGAIMVIAVFYTDEIQLAPVAWGVGLVVLLFIMGRLGIRSINLYIVVGALFWVAVLKSGVHATIAGVILAMLTPAAPYYRERDFDGIMEDLLDRLRHARESGNHDLVQQTLRQMEDLSRGSESPLDRLEHALAPWASYLILPIFAFANAGVKLSGDMISDAATSPVTLGVAMGLVIGKPIGVLFTCWLAVRLGWAQLPNHVDFQHLIGVGLLAGIGFTVALFITGLAFEDPVLVDEGKVGILVASAVAGIVGFAYLWLLPRTHLEVEPEPAEVAEPEPGFV